MLILTLSMVCREENQIVPLVVQAVLNLPENAHIAVRYTSLHLVGELYEWIEKHPDFLGELTLYFVGCGSLFVFFCNRYAVFPNIHLSTYIAPIF